MKILLPNVSLTTLPGQVLHLPNCKITLTSHFLKKIYDKFTVLTDKNGLYVFDGKAYILKAMFAKNGYYSSYGEIKFNFRTFTYQKGEVFKPDNQLIVVKLRRKIDPTPMYVQRVDESKVPKFGQDCGYDLLIGDWVKPYGQGKVSDFIINCDGFQKPPLKKFGHGTYDFKLTMTFSNPNDGIQKIILEKEKKTGFRSLIKCPFKFIYKAPLTGYQPILKEYTSFDGNTHSRSHNRNANYIFRIRTKTDKKGNIISALYGKIYGQIEHGKYIQFTYYVNPTPNSRSMEWNRKNVIKKIKGKNYSPWDY